MENIQKEFNFEVKTSKTEKPVPVVNGVHLHSIYNPEKEAEGFVSQHERSLAKSPNVLLFGLGFGYHLKQIEHKMKTLHGDKFNIYVIEPSTEVFDECLLQGYFNPSQNVKVFNKSNVAEYFSDRDLADFMTTKPTVIPHPASFNLHEAFFKAFMAYKAATDIESISLFIENRELRGHFRSSQSGKLFDEAMADLQAGHKDLQSWDHLILAFNEIATSGSNGV